MDDSPHESPRVATSAHFLVVEDRPERLVVHIPSGGPRTSALGCLAAIVNGFLIVATLVAAAIAIQAETSVLLAVGAALGLFWLVGLLLVYHWLRMKYTRFNILAEPGRLVVESVFADRKKLQETRIDANSTIDLVEAYKVNDVPVHAITVSGLDGRIRFGTALSNADKELLVRRMRIATGLEDRLSQESHEEGQSAEPLLAFDDIDPLALAPPSLVRVDVSNPSRLELKYPAFDPIARWPVAGCLSLLGLFLSVPVVFVFLFVVMLLGAAQPAVQVTGSLLIGAGLPVLLVASILRSHVHVVVDHKHVRVQWIVGPLRIKRTAAIADVRQVLVTARPPGELQGRGTGGRHRTIQPDRGVMCVVMSTARTIPLTSNLGETTCREVAGLIRGRLRRLGCQV